MKLVPNLSVDEDLDNIFVFFDKSLDLVLIVDKKLKISGQSRSGY